MYDLLVHGTQPKAYLVKYYKKGVIFYESATHIFSWFKPPNV